MPNRLHHRNRLSREARKIRQISQTMIEVLSLQDNGIRRKLKHFQEPRLYEGRLNQALA